MNDSLLPGPDWDLVFSETSKKRPADVPVYDEGIRPASTHAERATSLVGMPQAALVETIRDAAMMEKIDWLRSALDIGAFSFSRGWACNPQTYGALHAASAVVDFLKNAQRFAYNTDPVYGLLEADTLSIKIDVGDEFRAFYNDFGHHLVNENRKAFRESIASAEGDACASVNANPDGWRLSSALVRPVFSRVLMGAMALGDADLVALMTKHSPDLLHTELSLAEMEKTMGFTDTGFCERIDASSPSQVAIGLCPMFVGLQFGQVQAMDAARSEGLEGAPFATWVRPLEDGKSKGMYGEGLTDHCMESIDLVGVLTLVAPLCAPSVLGREIELALSTTQHTPEQLLALHNVAMRSLDRSQPKWQCLTPAFHAAGVYEIDPTQTVREALQRGVPERVGVKGAVLWDEIFSPDVEKNAPMQAMISSAQSVQGKHDKAIEAAIHRACSDGFADLVLRQAAVNNPEQTTNVVSDSLFKGMGEVMEMPMAFYVVEKFDDVVLAMLKIGYDPKTASVKGADPLLKVSDQVNPALSHKMRTYANRQKAIDALAELDLPEQKMAP